MKKVLGTLVFVSVLLYGFSVTAHDHQDGGMAQQQQESEAERMEASGLRLRRAGTATLIPGVIGSFGGLGLLVGGLVVAGKSTTSANTTGMGTGAAMALTGGLLMPLGVAAWITGGVLRIVGRNRIRRANEMRSGVSFEVLPLIDPVNKTYGASLSFNF